MKHMISDVKVFHKPYWTRKIVSILRFVFFLGMGYVLLYPLLLMLSLSVRTEEDLLNASVTWIPSGFTLDNFKKAINFLNYGESLPFTVFIVLISTVLSLITCSMAGYAIGRYRLKTKAIWVAICVFSILVPMQTYLIPYFFQMKNFTFWGLGWLIAPFNGGEPFSVNLLDSCWTYFLPAVTGAGLRSGLYVLLFMQGFAALPQELEDAARIDGCTEVRTFARIMIPNMKSTFLVVFLLSIVWNWSEYYYPMMMMGKSAMLSTALSSLREQIRMSLFTSSEIHASTGGEMSVILFAGVFLFIWPVLVLYLLLQKKFVEGMERTGIVG